MGIVREAQGMDEDAATVLEALALEARAGRSEAAARLWAACGPRLARIALALGVPAQDVPDLVQETLLAGHRALGSFDPAAGRFTTWIATILVRRSRNSRRAARRRGALIAAVRALGLPAPGRSTAAVDRAEARLTLARLVGCLTVVQREVIALYEIGDLAADEVARVMGISAAGVRSIARDARKRLADAARGPAAREGERR